MRYLLLLFLYGCTSSTPRLFADGAPLAPPGPRVTYTPTGTGLPPEYWGTPEAPKPERSPHARTLPQTPETIREPGLWAGDQPHAGPIVKAGGIVLQEPQEPTDVDHVIMRQCARVLESMVEELPRLREAYERLVFGEKMCAIAKAYEMCAEKDLLQAAAAQQNNAVMRLQRVRKAAKEMQKWACEYPRDTEPVADVVNLFDRLWGSR